MLPMDRSNRAGFAIWVALFAGVAFGRVDDVEPMQTALLSGRLRNAEGISISNATVVLGSAAAGGNLSAMRTTGHGRFAFSVISSRTYTLHFAAPGFAILTLPVSVAAGTTALELPDTVLTVGSSSAESLSPSTKQALSRTTLAADLLEQIENDLHFAAIEDCLRREGDTFEQAFRTTWLKLGIGRNDELLVEGLGPCVGGANNGPELVYARFGTSWHKIFDGVGYRLNTMPNRTRGFLDLARWQHGSAFMSAEIVYQFNGHEYQAVRCTDVEFEDWMTNKPYPTPKRTPCKN